MDKSTVLPQQKYLADATSLSKISAAFQACIDLIRKTQLTCDLAPESLGCLEAVAQELG